MHLILSLVGLKTRILQHGSEIVKFNRVTLPLLKTVVPRLFPNVGVFRSRELGIKNVNVSVQTVQK